MTSRSRKKHPTTAPTSSRATRTNRPAKRSAGKRTVRFALAILLAAPTSLGLAQLGFAQYPAQYQNLRPVPREGTRMVTPTPQSQQNHTALQWRRSPNVAPEQPVRRSQPQAQVQAQPQAQIQAQAQAQPHREVAQTSGLQVSGRPPQLQSVSQAAWMTHPARVDDLLNAPPSGLRVAQATDDKNDFFSNPFGDDPGAASTRTPTSAMEAVAPPSIADDPIDEGFLFPPDDDIPAPKTQATPQASPTLPNETKPMNELRDSFGFPEKPDAAPATRPQLRMNDGPSLGDILRDSEPDEDKQSSELPPPKKPSLDRSGSDLFDNPFPSRSGDDKKADAADRDRLNDPIERDDDDASEDKKLGLDDDDLKNPGGITCSDFRERIAFQTIDKISLDISPPYRPDEIEQKRYEKLKEDFDEKQSIRQWRTIDGTPMASGRLRDLAYEKVIIETDFGTIEELPIDKVSEADLAYISENWGLPKECRIEQVAYVPRSWTPTTMTYKASNLCHTPLYFEDVNLERYGHTHGPVLEPFVQTAHFFGNIAVLPYKMGVHQPNECTYSLGYYRPGNCAPWITPPIPLSLRGALYQGAAVTGMFWLLP